MTIGALRDERLEETRGDVSPRTWLHREGFVRLHIKPSLGSARLANLTDEGARRLYKRK
jgi:hypothetical protein